MSKLPGGFSPVNKKDFEKTCEAAELSRRAFLRAREVWLLTSPRTNAGGNSDRTRRPETADKHPKSAAPKPVKPVKAGHAPKRAKPEQFEDPFPRARHGFAHIPGAA